MTAQKQTPVSAILLILLGAAMLVGALVGTVMLFEAAQNATDLYSSRSPNVPGALSFLPLLVLYIGGGLALGYGLFLRPAKSKPPTATS